MDGNREDRTDTVSVSTALHRPSASIPTRSRKPEAGAASAWLTARVAEGAPPETFGVFVRSGAELPRAVRAVERAGLRAGLLDKKASVPAGHVSVGTMHPAKGLEFWAVVVMACDDEVLPLQERIEAIGDEADLREVYETERHQLRARGRGTTCW